jgi:hypothetical protein
MAPAFQLTGELEVMEDTKYSLNDSHEKTGEGGPRVDSNKRQSQGFMGGLKDAGLNCT